MSHRPAELRSIELHRAVARAIRADETVLDRARQRVEQWNADGGPVPEVLAQQWKRVLAEPVNELLELIVADTGEMRDLRQVTPFAGVVDSRERWDIIRRVG